MGRAWSWRWLSAEFHSWAIPRPRVVYLFESVIAFGFEIGNGSSDPIVQAMIEVKVASLPPWLGDLLARVLP